MVEKKNTLERIGLTRGKAILVGVLAVVLVGVIYIQYGRTGTEDVALSAGPALESPPPPPAVTTAALPATVAERPAASKLQSPVAEFDQTRWQPPELTEVIAYDPFALPAAFPQPVLADLDPQVAAAGTDPGGLAEGQLAEAVEQLQRDLEDLQQRGVHVIVGDGGTYVAMIGDRALLVGDEINGFTVTAIERDGVRVEWKGL